MHAVGVHDPTKSTQQLACHYCYYHSYPDCSCAILQITCRSVNCLSDKTDLSRAMPRCQVTCSGYKLRMIVCKCTTATPLASSSDRHAPNTSREAHSFLHLSSSFIKQLINQLAVHENFACRGGCRQLFVHGACSRSNAVAESNSHVPTVMHAPCLDTNAQCRSNPQSKIPGGVVSHDGPFRSHSWGAMSQVLEHFLLRQTASHGSSFQSSNQAARGCTHIRPASYTTVTT